MKNATKIFNNKKAGEFISGVWILLLVLYFSIFIFIVNGSQNLDTEININSNYTYSDYEILGYNDLGQCNLPRYMYSTLDGEIKETKYADNMLCEISIGVSSETTCNNISGCNWTEVTSGFWLWKETFDTCTGNINGSFYGIETLSFLGSIYSKKHDNIKLSDKNNVCTHPNVINDREMCDLFSCTWKTTDITDIEYKSFLSTIADLFTFRYNFGFDNNTIAYLFTFIFFILPIFMIIIAIYFAIPLIH